MATSSHEHTKPYSCIQDKTQSGWATAGNQVSEKKKSTWKQVGEAETHSCYKPHPQHSDSQLGGDLKPWATPPGTKDLNPTSGTPTFKSCPWEEEHTKHLILKATGLCPGDPQALVNWEIVPKRPLMDTDRPARAQWRRSYLERAQATWERGLFAYLKSLSLRYM